MDAALGLVPPAPAAGTRLALRLFFTPLPTKAIARRRPVPAPWRAQRFPFEGGHVVLWRRPDVEAADRGRPVVLLVHGWAGDAMQMRPLGDALAQAGFAPLLLDFPGHGRSDGWRSLRRIRPPLGLKREAMTDTTENPILELDAIDTYYGPVQAHFGLSLKVGKGEIVSLLGGNASGKSTTM